jgi:A/G-specific adenine glycosylase
MDLGATICTPRQPDCAHCPLSESCQAYALEVQEERPVLERKPTVPHFTVTAAIIRRDTDILLTRRPENGFLGGLWEFPGGKQQPGEDLSTCLRREICEELGVEVSVGDLAGVYRHTYTHFRVTLHAFHCRLTCGEPIPLEASELRWVQPVELGDFPMGKIDRQIASYLLNTASRTK